MEEFLVFIDRQGDYFVFDLFENEGDEHYPGCTSYKTNEKSLVFSSGENPYNAAFDADESDGDLEFLSNNGAAVSEIESDSPERAILEVLFQEGF